MIEVLDAFDVTMTSLSLNYEYGEMTQSPPKYPYWVSEISEADTNSEDGRDDGSIILTGFSRGKHIELLTEYEKIKKHFKDGFVVLTENNEAILICYAGGFPIPVENKDLKKYQVTLSTKLWKGE